MISRRIAVLFLNILAPAAATAQWGGTIRFCIRAEPKTFHPLQVADEASETVRYLTSGVLVRSNRYTQALEPELAASWKVLEGSRAILFQLRKGVQFSDGTPFTAEDVVHTIGLLADPALKSPQADALGGPGGATARALAPDRVEVRFRTPMAGVERLFDQLAILSARSPKKEGATLGPFQLQEHRPGVYVQLARNPNYWKRDAGGRRLPYADGVRLDVQQNREMELLRFRRGELHLIARLDAEMHERLAAEAPERIRDAGPSLEAEQMWFNQVASAPIPDYRKAWFRSKTFRRAVSSAIHRADLARVVFKGLAAPAVGPVAPANRFWFNAKLKPHAYDPKAALGSLTAEGFRRQGDGLVDRAGNRVEFSLITNAGNKTRERMAAMIQQDLAQIGIRVNVVTLDFPSLIERITRTANYEACLLGLVNVDLDPNGQMNVWLSSAPNHQWNPSQKSPETPWEAEIDRLMKAQASATNAGHRKRHFDRVQEIVWEEAPFLYLVQKNALAAVGPALRNAQMAVLHPQVFWNADRLYLASSGDTAHNPAGRERRLPAWSAPRAVRSGLARK